MNFLKKLIKSFNQPIISFINSSSFDQKYFLRSFFQNVFQIAGLGIVKENNEIAFIIENDLLEEEVKSLFIFS